MVPHAAAIAVAALAALAGGSAVQRPILYPNSHYVAVGRAASERDIAECVELSRDHGVNERRDGKVARSAAAGAAIGGVAGGAWGAVRGKDAVERAAAGAAVGATGGAVRGAVRSDDTSKLYKRFVQRCLADKGYDVVGWQ